MADGWSDLYARRKDAQRRFGRSVFALPLLRRPIDRIAERVHDGHRLLDVGAAGERLRTSLEARGRKVAYESLEPDPAARADHRSFETVEPGVDVVVCLEVLEHLDLDDVRRTLEAIRGVLVPGGTLVLSVPNVFRPHEFLRDATHRTPLCWDQLVAFVERAGLGVSFVGRGHAAPPLKRFVQRVLFGWLFRLIGIDYARQIVLVATRPVGQDDAEL